MEFHGTESANTPPPRGRPILVLEDSYLDPLWWNVDLELTCDLIELYQRISDASLCQILVGAILHSTRSRERGFPKLIALLALFSCIRYCINVLLATYLDLLVHC